MFYIIFKISGPLKRPLKISHLPFNTTLESRINGGGPKKQGKRVLKIR